MPRFGAPQEILNLRQIKKMSSKEIRNEINRLRNIINLKLRRLENANLTKYSHSYQRIKDYIKDRYGTKYLPASNKMNRASKIEYLQRLYSYSTAPLGLMQVRKIAREEKANFEKQLSTFTDSPITHISWTSYNRFRDLMEKMRESGLIEIYGSDTFYEFGLRSVKMISPRNFESFLNQFFILNPSSPIEADSYLSENWDWNFGRFVSEVGYSPRKNNLYYEDIITHELINSSGKKAKYSILKNGTIKLDGEVIEEGALYDFISEYKNTSKNKS